MKNNQRFPALMLLAITAWATGAFSAESSDAPFLLDKNVQETITTLTAGYQPKEPIASLKSKSAMSSGTSEDTTTYTLMEEGLIASAFRSKSIGVDAETRSLNLSLCGLVNVLSTGMARASSEMSIPILAGKVFVPFGFRTTHDASHTYRVNNLEVDTKNICSPVLGSNFIYRIQVEVAVKSPALFGGSQMSKSKSVVETRCAVSSEEKPASSLLPTLRGNYVDVSCEQQQQGRGAAHLSFAFLRDSGLYLLKRQKNDWGDTSFTYESVQYLRQGD